MLVLHIPVLIQGIHSVWFGDHQRIAIADHQRCRDWTERWRPFYCTIGQNYSHVLCWYGPWVVCGGYQRIFNSWSLETL